MKNFNPANRIGNELKDCDFDLESESRDIDIRYEVEFINDDKIELTQTTKDLAIFAVKQGNSVAEIEKIFYNSLAIEFNLRELDNIMFREIFFYVDDKKVIAIENF